MRNATKTIVTAAVAALSISSSMATAAMKHYDFHWSGQVAGFSVMGSFSFDDANADANGLIDKNDLASFDVSFYDPNGSLMRTYVDNHLPQNNPLFNFHFDSVGLRILQDGTYNEDGSNVDGDGNAIPAGFLMGEGDPALRSQPGQSGLAFWTRPSNDKVPHLHVDDWDEDFGYADAFSSHQDVSFPYETTQQLINKGKVWIDLADVATGVGEYGQRVEVTPVPLPPALAMFAGALLAMAPFRRRAGGSRR